MKTNYRYRFCLFLVLFGSLVLVGCGEKTAPKTLPVLEATATERSRVSTLIEEGGSCAEKLCQSGLECNADKICINPVVDAGLDCSGESKKPVCAEKDGVQKAYLSECGAKKYGAKVLHQGFCK